MQIRPKNVDILSGTFPMESLDAKQIKFEMVLVPKDCNMIDLAMDKIDDYDPDSGNGYYQFIEETEEYISPKTRVALVNEVSTVI